MKPNFALSLSVEGIGLLHRAFPGWNRVGEVALDSTDLPGALAVLRDTAQQINGQDLHAKLVIPNDQIKYLNLDLGILTEDQRHEAIHEALIGATPYPVDNLVFDWSVESDHTHVAAVARETLAEAEDFAIAHGFTPISFVAIPPEGAFSGEPFFGPSKLAPSLLPEGETVQRDMAPIRVTGVVRLPDPEDALADAVPTDKTPLAGAASTIPETTPAPAAEPESAPETGPELEPDPAPEKSAAPEIQTEEPPHSDDTEPPFSHHAQEDTAEPHAPEETDQQDDEDQDDEEDTQEADLLHASLLSDTLPELDAPIIATPGASDTGTAPAFSTIRAEREAEMPDAAPSLSGVSRSTIDLTAPAPSVSDFDAFDDPAAPAIETTPESYNEDDRLDADLPLSPTVSATDAPATPAQDSLDPAEPNEVSEDSSAENTEPRRPGRLAFMSQRSGKMAAGLAASLAARNTRHAEAQAETRPKTGADRASERQRMTVFGARKPEPETASVGGKPRYLGLILTAVLLLFLAGVAAWASLFMDDGLARLFGPRDTAVAMLPQGAEDETNIEGEEAMVPEAPSGVTVETTSRSTATPAPEPTTTATPPLAQPHALTSSEAQARYAVTGVWQRAPQAPQLPDETSLDDLYLTSIDPSVDAQDAVALPAMAALETDFTPGRIAPPVPQGAHFDLDDRGLVVARPNGARSPEGFLVFAGRPVRVPPATPDTVNREAQETTQTQAALAAKRPKARPEGLIESNQRSMLGGLTNAELATKRPKARPASLIPEPAVQPAAVTEAIAEANTQPTDTQPTDTPAPTAEAAAPKIIGTEFAVAQSRKPMPRPNNFSRIVDRAQQAKVTKVAAAVPRQQKTAPSVPSRANVAKAATVRNQINLRKINLIGVYGKPNSRRALVRLSNGRYKKVKVGDRLDGGRISAIGDTELRYTKRGRNVILKMPRG